MFYNRFLLSTGVAALMLLGLGASARAASMSAEAFLKAVNTNADKTISRNELDAYAKKRFAEFETDKDKTLDRKELKGRLSEAGMAMADTDKDKTVDEAEFVGYADKLFDEADIHKKDGAEHPSLTKRELESPAGEKLMTLLH